MEELIEFDGLAKVVEGRGSPVCGSFNSLLQGLGYWGPLA
jgi:hypothetical protein